jgi:hypothetical protein
MSIGISVNVGLNKTTSNVFHADPLAGCENDAKAMHAIAIDRGFESATLLINGDATLEKVKNAVKAAAARLKADDLFLFTFAGHGTFKVKPTATEEVDKHDESIVLADHLLIDNSWQNELWPLFKPGVRVVAVADCCHSGTVLLSAPSLLSAAKYRSKARQSAKVKPKLRELSHVEREKELAAFPEVYAQQLAPTGNVINCRRIFLSACQDDQKAADGQEHGAFTKELLNVWANGGFTGNYNELIDKIKAPFVNSAQTPNLTPFGSPDFTTQRPFTI